MNDFLQNLRGGQKDKRPQQKTRRGFDNTSTHYNQPPTYPTHGGYQNPRGGGNVKRVTRSNAPSKYPVQEMDVAGGGVNQDLTERALDMLDGFLKTQERLVDIQQRRIIVEERKAEALEDIAEHLRHNNLSPLAGGAPAHGMSAPVDPVNASPSEFFGEEMTEDISTSYYNNDIPEHDLHAEGLFDETPSAEARMPVSDDAPSSRYRDPVPTPHQVPSHVDVPNPLEKKVKLRKEKNGVQRDSRSAKGSRRLLSPVKKEVKVLKRSRGEKRQTKTVEPVVAAPSGLKGPLPREEVMDIIDSMRGKGATFDQVAQYLVEIGQPTFSGRGEWHAQTVHRLCNRKG